MTPTEFRALKPKKPGKYQNVKGEADGLSFDSQKEKKRYGQLKMLLRAKLISELELQARFPILVNGVKICTYIADFKYIRDRKLVAEDTKGFRTPVYRLKKKLVEAIYGIKILET